MNNVIVKKPETKLDTDSDHVLFDGVLVGYAQHEYYMLNKPAGVISATEDKREKTVIDLIIERKRKIFSLSEDLIEIQKDCCLFQMMVNLHIDFCHHQSMWIKCIMQKLMGR